MDGVTVSLHGDWVSVTVSTTTLYQMHPQTAMSILQGDSWAGNIRFNFQQFHWILWKSEIYYRVHKNRQ